jgi:hypothetical protein
VGKDAFWSTKTVSPAFAVQRWPKENKNVQNLIFNQLAISAFLVVGVLVAYGLILFVLSKFDFDLIGMTSLTVYGFFALASMFLLFCHLVDIWDFFDPRPVRLTALVLGILFLIFSLGTNYGRQAAIGILILLTMLSVRSIRRNPEERKHQFLAIAFVISIILLIVMAEGRATATTLNASKSHKKEVPKRAYNRFFGPEMKLLRTQKERLLICLCDSRSGV